MEYNHHSHRYQFHFHFLAICAGIALIIAGILVSNKHGSAASFCNIDSFTANPLSIDTLSSSTLSWTTSGCDSIYIINNSINAPILSNTSVSGTYKVSPKTTTQYLISGQGNNGTVWQTQTIYVNTIKSDTTGGKIDVTKKTTPTQDCVVNSFSATPSTISKGNSSVLSWSTTGDCGILSIADVTNQISIADVTGKTSYVVKPSASTQYGLDAITKGQIKYATVTVFGTTIVDNTIVPNNQIFYNQYLNEANPVRNTGGWSPYGPQNRAYGGGGLNDADPTKTQGVISSYGGSSYGVGGLNETIGSPTKGTTVTIKNCEFFTGYHRFGDRGGDIGKIQLFLQDRGYYTGKINGVYGIETFRAVKAFQKDFATQVLVPWELKTEAPTGFWYKSTRKKANQLIGCPEPAVYLERVNKLLDY